SRTRGSPLCDQIVNGQTLLGASANNDFGRIVLALLGRLSNQFEIFVRSEGGSEKDRASLRMRQGVSQIFDLVIGIQWDQHHSSFGDRQLNNQPMDRILSK